MIKVVKRAIQLSSVDFTVVEGVRTHEKQAEYMKAGATKTLNSRHIPDCNGCKQGCAVDLAPFVDGDVRWDWPLFTPISVAMKAAAKELGVALVWGGDWLRFKDGPHFELDRKVYP